MSSSQQAAFLATALARVAHSVREAKETLVEQRRAVCRACDQAKVRSSGAIRCRLCRCSDPSLTRPRCPVWKW